MTFEELIKTNDSYNSQIETIRKEQSSFQLLHNEEFRKSFAEKQANDRKWFVQHLDQILKHQDLLKCKKPFDEIVIDFLPIYVSHGLCCGAAYTSSKYCVKLKTLLEMWNNGLTYNGYPVIAIENCRHNSNGLFTISYVKDSTEQTIGTSYDYYNRDKVEDKEIVKIIGLIMVFINKLILADNLNFWDNYPRIDLLKKAF